MVNGRRPGLRCQQVCTTARELSPHSTEWSVGGFTRRFVVDCGRSALDEPSRTHSGGSHSGCAPGRGCFVHLVTPSVKPASAVVVCLRKAVQSPFVCYLDISGTQLFPSIEIAVVEIAISEIAISTCAGPPVGTWSSSSTGLSNSTNSRESAVRTSLSASTTCTRRPTVPCSRTVVVQRTRGGRTRPQ